MSTLKTMKEDSSYHHGDLRAALVKAAALEIERSGFENLSLRELAESVGVSRAAPYRHFADRRALLAAVARDGFERLTIIYRRAMGGGKAPRDRLAAAGRGYLRFAAERPQMFRLMFVSDLLGGGTDSPDAALIDAASECYSVFENIVAATLDYPNDRTVKAATIKIMSTGFGFALLRMNNRLRPFVCGPLTQSELVDAVLSIKV
jgi:AcrR family transcriptional regulator